MAPLFSIFFKNRQEHENIRLLNEPSHAQLRRMKELYQDPRKTRRDVDEIRKWVSNQPHLPKVTDDKFIENFLFGCKYDVQKTKTMMDRYFCVRGEKKHFFEGRDPSAPDIAQSFEVVYSIPMPELTPEGYRVITVGLLDGDPHKFSFLSLIRRNLMMVDYGLTQDSAIGMIAVADCSKMSLRHLGQLSVTYMKDYLYCSLDAAPLRVQDIHLVNMPSFYGTFVSLLTRFLPKQLQERVHQHGTIEELHDYVPKRVLPVELGGDGPSVKDLNESWHKFLIANKEWFLTEGSKKADLNVKQEENPTYNGHWYSFGGIFRGNTTKEKS
nr:PREDICTED: alpha-tocopherol transfer protein-like isoform X1 [Bemisia tabaci]